MLTVAVWGTTSSLGRRVTARLASQPDVLTRALEASTGSSEGAPSTSDLAGVDALVLVGPPASPGDPVADGSGTGELPMAQLRRLLDAATEAGVGAVVAVSSATVYGAWEENPVPLTEEAPLRPSEDFLQATSRAELERLVAGWRFENPGAPAAVLRPVVVVDRLRRRPFQRSVWGLHRWLADEADPPLQLLDVDDLASAVEVAWRQGLDGPFNVAPDGWVDTAERQELTGRALPLPGLVRRWLRARRLKSHPGAAAYREHPWVVANDRLQAAGWEPAASTEELVVQLRGRRPWSPRARQEMSLVAVGVAALGAVVGAVLLVRRLRSRPRRG